MKDTSTALAQMGESLARSFYDRLLGLGLPEDAAFELPVSDLSALFSLGEDIHHWQNVEMDWEQLEAQFTGGFVPENLIAPGGSGNTEEQNTTNTRTGTPRRQPQMRNYPFVTDSTNRVFADRETAYSRVLEPPTDQITETPQPLQNNPQPIAGTTPPETNIQDVGSSLPGAMPSSLLDGPSVTPRTPNFQEPAETRINGPMDRANPESLPSLSTKPENHPNNLAAFHPEPAPSIWSQPLQGLGDFVSHYEPSAEPVSGKEIISGQSPGPIPPVQVPPVNDSNHTLMPLAAEDLLTGPAIVQPESVPAQQQRFLEKNVDIPENQTFKSIENNPDSTAVLPDTDDILDELTQRIIRDFRRFYP